MNAVASDEALLRPMVEEDLPGVMRVETLNYPFPWSIGIFHDCIKHRYSGWVYEHQGSVIGYGVMSAAAGEAHILNISIDPGYMGRGLGRRLLEHLLARANEFGAETVFLEVRPSNLPAIALYADSGFNQVGVRRDYYPGRDGREDALILARQLV